MKYVLLIFLIPAAFYALTFARYNWNKKNKRAVCGLILLVLASTILSFIAASFTD